MQLKHAFATLALVAPTFAEGVLQRRLSQQEIQDAQTSLTVLPESICQGCAFDGQQIPVAGQVASLTSKNNYINYCLQFDTPNQNGEQLFNGSCSQVPIGQIMAKNKMPSQKIHNPKNNDVIQEGTDIAFEVKVRNAITGHFTFAAATYYSAPSQVDPQSGFIIGHTHVSVDAINGLDDVEPSDPQNFAFFKGYDAPANGNGVVSVTAKGGLKAGTYRVCALGSNANHMPWVLPVAQRGFEGDCVRFTVQAGAGAGAGGASNATSSAAASSSSSTAAATTTSSAAATSSSTTASATATTGTGAGAGGNKNTGTTKNTGNKNGGGRQGGNRGGRKQGGKRTTNLPSRRTFSPSGRSRIARHE